MSAMKREKQYDMFDVATGACTLDDYLFQRYSENDLSSTFWIDEKDEVDELRPPEPGPDGQPGSEPVVIPIQGPRAGSIPGPPKPPPIPEGLTPDSPPGPPRSDHPLVKPVEPPAADGRDTLQKGSSAPDTPGLESFQKVEREIESSDSVQLNQESNTQPAGPTEAVPGPPSMADLLARFHQATKEYQERSQTPQESSVEDEGDSPAE